jgi:RND superfamily putative drug exporter
MARSTTKARKSNLAAEAGRWSAKHRRKAILGWLAFVLVTFVAGGLVNQRHLTQAEMSNGQSAQGLRAHRGGFPQARERAGARSRRRSLRIGGPALTAAVQDVVTRPERVR